MWLPGRLAHVRRATFLFALADSAASVINKALATYKRWQRWLGSKKEELLGHGVAH